MGGRRPKLPEGRHRLHVSATLDPAEIDALGKLRLAWGLKNNSRAIGKALREALGNYSPHPFYPQP